MRPRLLTAARYRPIIMIEKRTLKLRGIEMKKIQYTDAAFVGFMLSILSLTITIIIGVATIVSTKSGEIACHWVIVGLFGGLLIEFLSLFVAYIYNHWSNLPLRATIGVTVGTVLMLICFSYNTKYDIGISIFSFIFLPSIGAWLFSSFKTKAFNCAIFGTALWGLSARVGVYLDDVFKSKYESNLASTSIIIPVVTYIMIRTLRGSVEQPKSSQGINTQNESLNNNITPPIDEHREFLLAQIAAAQQCIQIIEQEIARSRQERGQAPKTLIQCLSRARRAYQWFAIQLLLYDDSKTINKISCQLDEIEKARRSIGG